MKILNILNGLDCGINWWDETNRRGIVDYRYLAKTTGSSISTSSTYILFLTEMQKRQTLVKRFALFKNDITGSELAFGIANILQKSKGWLRL